MLDKGALFANAAGGTFRLLAVTKVGSKEVAHVFGIGPRSFVQTVAQSSRDTTATPSLTTSRPASPRHPSARRTAREQSSAASSWSTSHSRTTWAATRRQRTWGSVRPMTNEMLQLER